MSSEAFIWEYKFAINSENPRYERDRTHEMKYKVLLNNEKQNFRIHLKYEHLAGSVQCIAYSIF